MQVRFIGGPLDGMTQVVHADMKEYIRAVPAAFGSYKYAHYLKTDEVINGVVSFKLKYLTDTEHGR